jgi:hypothetical protein
VPATPLEDPVPGRPPGGCAQGQWIRDPAVFAEYLRDLPPTVARYGGAADLSLRPTTIWADRLDLPDIVNLVHYDDRDAYHVELATCWDGTGEAYRSYEERGENRMRDYGYHVDYVLAAESAPARRRGPT